MPIGYYKKARNNNLVGVATVENIMEILKKLKIQTTVWTIYSECLSEENKTISLKRYKHLYVHYRIPYNSPSYGNNLSVNQLMKRVKKMRTYIQWEFYSVIKRWNFAIFSKFEWILIIMSSEVNQMKKEKYCLMPLICVV